MPPSDARLLGVALLCIVPFIVFNKGEWMNEKKWFLLTMINCKNLHISKMACTFAQEIKNGMCGIIKNKS